MIDLFDDPQEWLSIPMIDADVRFARRFYDPSMARHYMETLTREIAWREETIILWGKPYRQPRLSAWYGDAGCAYTYSGMRLEPQPWNDTLLQIKEDVERATSHRYNSVLLNLYRDEQDGMGWHSDNEPELGPQPVIASLSLGATRMFRLRHRNRKTAKPVALPLTDGSLLIMAGDTQRCWRHAIDKEHEPTGARINLTFRTILPTR